MCVLCCEIALLQAAQRGGLREAKKSTLHIGKYRDLRPLNAANTPGNYQKGFRAFQEVKSMGVQGWLICTHLHSGQFFFEFPMMPL